MRISKYLVILLFIPLTLYSDERIPISKKIIPVVEFIRKAVEDYSGINLEEARYFSRNLEIHPVASILLQDPIYSLIFFSKIQDSLAISDIPKIFFTIARLSANAKRIDLVRNPASDFFAKDEQGENADKTSRSAIYSLASCANASLERIKKFISKDEKYTLKTPENITRAMALISESNLRQDEIQSFLEILNTSFYILSHCALEFLKNTETQGKMKHEIPNTVVEIYDEKDDFVIIPESSAIIVNIGGNDTYFFKNWTGNVAPSVLIIFDFGRGDDTYLFLDPRPLSLSLVYDESGNDTYRCNIGCLGGGFLSAEVLYDGGGNDKYESNGISQGAGLLGTGVLVEISGDDTYVATTLSQGSGKVGGGILVDYHGNDRYVLKEGKEFPSFQDNAHNLSMGQGCGTGIRSDYIEELSSIPIGTGMLLDFSGNDMYSADVFSQGCGYWYGVGVLGDAQGDDIYRGYWYCQGSSAHFGVGVLLDASGNDSFHCTFQGQGHGHDLGAGVFGDFDRDDSDELLCSVRCLGSAHANGVSVFINQGGSDIYRAGKVAFGDSVPDIYERKEHSIRQIIPTRGFFIDIGGENDLFFFGEKKTSRDEVEMNWYRSEEMKRYLEESYIIRKFYKF